MKFLFSLLLILMLNTSSVSAKGPSVPLDDLYNAISEFEKNWGYHIERHIDDYNAGISKGQISPDKEPEYDDLTCLKLPEGQLYFKDAHDESKICRPAMQSPSNYMYYAGRRVPAGFQNNYPW